MGTHTRLTPWVVQQLLQYSGLSERIISLPTFVLWVSFSGNHCSHA